MGGKGVRRREKNYLAAHGGGHTQRLPPPPNASSIDKIPSKLRQLISLKGKEFKKGHTAEKEGRSGDGSNSTTTTIGMKRKGNDQNLMADKLADGDEKEKKKKKRKRNTAEDLRFESKEGGAVGNRKKENRKQRLEAKKNKKNKDKSEDELGFRGHEDIKFGDVVQAPLKLLAVPKAFKTIQDASKERLRLQAVEAYRARKKWDSRPGVALPPPVTSSSSSSLF